MIIFKDIKSYNFEDQKYNRIHIPRIYLNNFKQISEALEVLKEKNYLNNSEMTKETSRIRAEHIREILIILWRLGCGVDVARQDRSYCFKAKDSIDQKLLNEKDYNEFILNKLILYNPFSTVLRVIKNKISKNENWNEKVIKKIFHYSDAKGNSDNIHPLMRWIKGFNFISEDLKISESGEDFLKKVDSINPYFLHENIDFDNDKLGIIIAEILHQSSLDSHISFPKKLKISQLKNLDFLADSTKIFLEKNTTNIKKKLNEFINKKLPVIIKEDELILNNPIFFDIKPKSYVNFQLNKYFKEAKKISHFNNKKIDLKKNQSLIIKDDNQKSNLEYLPSDCKIISYSDFENNKNYIIDKAPKFIFLTQNWKPIKNLSISGNLYAYVKHGGNLVVIGGQKGRIGANMNMFSWLPHELTKINYLQTKKEKYFKFTFGENLSLCKFLFKKTLLNKDDCYLNLSLSFFSGTITFIGEEKKIDYNFKENFFSNNLSINSASKEWVNSEIIHQCTLVKNERKMYPILREFMKKNFNFEFDLKILGHSGQTDIFMNSPFNCLFEVDTVGVNQVICQASKVSEVDRHFRKMKKQGFFEKSGKCVVAYEFSDMSGDDREGTIETAKDYSVNLMRYKDLYDISCFKKITKEELQNLIYEYDEKKPEISLKLLQLYEKYKNL